MRVTVFRAEGENVAVQRYSAPAWQPFDEFDGKPLDRVRLVEVEHLVLGEIQLVEIRAGGRFAMHTSPHVAFCQIVRGRGKLGLPGGEEVPYEAPELYIFFPGSLHDWHDIEEDTLLSVCLVRPGDGDSTERNPSQPNPASYIGQREDAGGR